MATKKSAVITEALQQNEQELTVALQRQREKKLSDAQQDLSKVLSDWSERWSADLVPQVVIAGKNVSHSLSVALR